jgi:copper resistance protein B
MRYLNALFLAVLVVGCPLTVRAGSAVHMDDEAIFSQLMLDQLENRFGGNGDTLAWQAQFWSGGDFNKLWIKTEGERRAGRTDSADVQLLYDHAVSTFWDLQAGVRQDFGYAPSRSWLALGIQGLAPYLLDIEATGFMGPAGRTAARFRASYELLFTQRLILEPELEANLYGRDDLSRRIGSGLSNIEFGLRLRYEVRRKFAPYVGVVYARSYGQTATYLQLAGERAHETRLVAGLRAWF